jgi:hypothetical protein
MVKVSGKGKRYTGCIESAWKTIYRMYGKVFEISEANFPTPNQGKMLCQYITVYSSLHTL